MARVEDKAKYVAFPWMVECEVNGHDEVYDAGIWFSQTDGQIGSWGTTW